MRRVAFVHRAQNLAACVPGDVVITASHAVREAALARGFECLYEHDFVSVDEAERIHLELCAHRTGWAEKMLGERRSRCFDFAGYRLEEFVDYELSFPFVEILIGLRVMTGVTERFAPEAVLCDPSDQAQAQIVAGYFEPRGVPVERLPAQAPRRTTRVRRVGPIKGMRSAWRHWRMRPEAHGEGVPARAAYLASESEYARALARAPARDLAFLQYKPSRALSLPNFYLRANPTLRRRLPELHELERHLADAWKRVQQAVYPIEVEQGGPAFDARPVLEEMLRFLLTGEGRLSAYRSPLASVNPISLFEYVRAALCMEELFERNAVRVVVLSHDSVGAGAMTALVARRLGIPSLVLQHGVPADMFPLKADCMLFWGSYGVDFFAANGSERERLIVTGRPLPMAPCVSGALPGSERARTGPPRVAYIGQPYTGLNPRHPAHAADCHLHGVLEEARRRPDVHFVVRPHMLEDAQAIRAQVRKLGLSNVEVGREEDIDQLIRTSDVLVVHNSTVGLDALMLGLRIVMVNFSERPDAVEYAESPNCSAAYSAEEFSQALDRELRRELPAIPRDEDPFLAHQIAQSGEKALHATLDMVRRYAAG